jgi:hypothetical protein
MDLADYRRDFGRFNSSLELARYHLRTQTSSEEEFIRFFDRFAHLFDRATVVELISLAQTQADATETEFVGRRRLAGAAALQLLELAIREYEEEWQRCAAASRIIWRDRRLAPAAIPAAISDESDRKQRNELYERWVRSLKDCAAPRMEWLAARCEVVHELGFAGLGELWSWTRRVDLGGVQTAAASFLRRTEAGYFQALAKWRERNTDPFGGGDLGLVDRLRFRRLSHFDRIFRGAAMPSVLINALAQMGLDPAGKPGLAIEFDSAPATGVSSAVFPLQAPTDVRAVVAATDGAAAYRAMFDAAGQAEFSAWNSGSFFDKNPEFIFSPDRGNACAFGQLFANLHLDRNWLSEHCTRGRESTASELVAELALLTLLEVRENCASLIFWYDHDQSGGEFTERAETDYSAQLRAATGFARDGATLYAEADQALAGADGFRGLMFETVLAEHLRSQSGSRWWTSRRAADELRDLWNTASRYSVEELSRMLGLGELEPDPLADRLLRLIEQP